MKSALIILGNTITRRRATWLVMITFVSVLLSLSAFWALSVAAAPVALTFTVNDAGDAADLNAGDGVCDSNAATGDQCTLRAAIQEANAMAGDDTINFSLATPVTINLTGALPDLTSNITITGPSGEVTVRRNTTGNYRIFTIVAGQVVNISNLTLTNGRIEEGGAIRNSGTLTLTACTLNGNATVGGNADNHITGGGGAIFNASTGTLTINRSTFFSNTATGGAGITKSGGGGGGLGGAILNAGGMVTITNSTLSGNTATGGEGGDAGSGVGGVSGGGGGGDGGATSLPGNFGGGGGGGNGGGAGGAGGAGGRFGGGGGGGVGGGTTAAGGAGGFLGGNGHAGATNGGGSPSFIAGGGGGGGAAGGGIFNNGGSATLVNVTLVSNTATGGAGGTSVCTGSCGGLGASGAAGSSRGGGIYNEAGTLSFKNSIIAGNTAASNADCDFNTTAPTSQGYNLTGTGGGAPTGATGDQTVAPANLFTTVLGTLQNNGGHGRTHALLTGSPAIDAGSAHAGVTTDQRNLTRPVDVAGVANAANGSDIGAFESQLFVDPNGTTDGEFSVFFNENGSPVTASSNLLIYATTANLQSATVTITNLLNGANEVLAATPSGAITAGNISYSSGVLTITANAPVADYQAVLRTVTYNNTAHPPNTTPRSLAFRANDGAFTSSPGTSVINISRAPVITPQTVTLKQGSIGNPATIATVSDNGETPPGNLTVTANPPADLTVASITNTNGTITALLSATCSATLGNRAVPLTVTDATGAMTTANLTINVTANTPAVLGTYSAGGTITGYGEASITPSGAPTDNGTVISLTASAPGFAGFFSGVPATGVINIFNASPAGSYTATVAATDNCGATSTTTFSFTVGSGTPPPATFVTDVNPLGDANPSDLVALNGFIYFSAEAATGDEELWRYDPATRQTTRLTNFDDNASGTMLVGRLVVFNNQIIFAGQRTAAEGLEPWRYDPATNTASLIRDINTATSGAILGSNPANFNELGGKLYFIADDGPAAQGGGGNGTRIWVYDPATQMATRLIPASGATPTVSGSSLLAFNNKLYFASSGNDTEFWDYNPATNLFTEYDINTTSGTASSFPGNFTVLGGKIYLNATNTSSNNELFVFDPAASTMTMVKEINPSTTSGSSPGSLLAYNNKLYFRANNGTNGSELWVHNPALPLADPNATLLTDEINPSGSASVSGLTVLNGKIYFRADNGTAGDELWVHDPTLPVSDPNANTLAADIEPAGDSSPFNLIAFNGKLYFQATAAAAGSELFAFDPMTGTASLVMDINPGANSSSPANFTLLGSYLYFTATDGVHGTEIWRLPAVNNAPTISDIANQTINEDAATGALAFTIGDDLTPAASLTLSGSSSNTLLVPNANIVFNGSGANRNVTVTPAANQFGTATITLTVTDGESLMASDTFMLTVNAINDPPTITDITNQTINEDGNTGALAFTIGDAETAVTSLSLSGSSSNTALVPNANIVFGGSGASRTVTVTPAANQSGTATITITVTDANSGTASDSFMLTVNAVNDPPTISDITNQTINEDGNTGALAFTVGDVETATGSLTLTGGSSNTALVPPANIVFGGSGASRTVTVTPVANQSGTATITVTVTDANSGTASDTFLLTVNSVNDPPTITDITNQTINEDANTGALAFTVGDGETAAGSLTLSGSSSNTALVPNANIVFGGSGGSRTVTVTPAANQFGTATITITVTDANSGTASDTFVLTVNAMNDPPTITDIANQTINEDGNTGALGITIGDAETPVASLSLSGSSSNTTLVPNANIVFGGSGASRTVTVTPVANQSGTATITVTVTDSNSGTASDTFVLTVNAVNDPPTISDVTNQTINEDNVTSALAFTVGDVETAAAGLTLSGSSSNTALVPNANIVFGGSGASRTVTVTPAANQSGTATITITVTDAHSGTASDTFLLTVNGVNDPPTISDITNQMINENGNTGALSFTIGDAETPTASLTLSGASSNTTLVPDANIVFGGSGANHTVTVTPAANQFGTVAITITITDANSGTASDTFVLTVNDAPTITASAITRQQGNQPTNVQIATVSDTEDAEETLTVTVGGGGSATNNGVTINNLTVSAAGQVRADLAVTCTAQNASFTLAVTDSRGVTANATLNVTVPANTAPAVGNYPNSTVITGGTLTITPDVPPTDNNTVVSVTATAVPNSFTGTFSGNTSSGGVTVANANPAGSYTLTVTLTDNCGATTTRSFMLTVSACGAVLSKQRELFAANGGSDSFTVTLDPVCSWTATSDNPAWITINAPVAGFAGSGTVSYSVAANNTNTRRTGSITVAGQTYRVWQSAQFGDVPLGHPFYDFIGKLSALGITLGCGGGNYCPDTNTTREQMAIFIERAIGISNPPVPTGQTFQDVPPTLLGYPFIEDLVGRGITAGCAAGPPRLFCPTGSVTREQMAIFILRGLGVFTPPAGPQTPTFADVANSGVTDYSYEFIEEFVRRGITSGCATGPLRYCPTGLVTRGQMAVFLVRAFGT
jgi:ELWxxDGT repeat protein